MGHQPLLFLTSRSLVALPELQAPLEQMVLMAQPAQLVPLDLKVQRVQQVRQALPAHRVLQVQMELTVVLTSF